VKRFLVLLWMLWAIPVSAADCSSYEYELQSLNNLEAAALRTGVDSIITSHYMKMSQAQSNLKECRIMEYIDDLDSRISNNAKVANENNRQIWDAIESLEKQVKELKTP